MNLGCNSNMSAIKINSKFDGKCSNNSAAVGLNFQIVFYVFIPRQRFILASCKHRIIFCHWFVAKTSKYTEHLLVVLIVTLQATVLKVIRIFLHQPDDNDSLVNLNVIVTLITCKSNWLILINRNSIIPTTREN